MFAESLLVRLPISFIQRLDSLPLVYRSWTYDATIRRHLCRSSDLLATHSLRNSPISVCLSTHSLSHRTTRSTSQDNHCSFNLAISQRHHYHAILILAISRLPALPLFPQSLAITINPIPNTPHFIPLLLPSSSTQHNRHPKPRCLPRYSGSGYGMGRCGSALRGSGVDGLCGGC